MRTFIVTLAICLLTACKCIGQSLPDSTKVTVTVGQMRNAVEDLRHYKVCQMERLALALRSIQCDSLQTAAQSSILNIKNQVDNRQNLIRDLEAVSELKSKIILNDEGILKATIKKKNRERWGWFAGGIGAGLLLGLIPKFISLAK